ncbi:MAG: hypothetical protein BGO47_13460 [Microbacterium sp. 67-17]|nr:MAG: hypothetical protein BGO47_13460 [Microbacterium sp. 67-17]
MVAKMPTSTALATPKAPAIGTSRPPRMFAAMVTTATMTRTAHHRDRGTIRMNSAETPAAGHQAATEPPGGVMFTLISESAKIAAAARSQAHHDGRVNAAASVTARRSSPAAMQRIYRRDTSCGRDLSELRQLS